MKQVIDISKVLAAVLLCALGTANHKSRAQEISVDSLNFYTIENCVNTFSKEGSVDTKTGYQYWFADKDFLDGRTLKLSVVAPNRSTHAPHKHPEDEFFFILEGRASFYLDGKSVEVGPYTSLYCPSNSMHGISNTGETDLKYLVIKKYENSK